MKKRIFWLILLTLLLVTIYFWQLIGYGLGQAKGQFIVLWNAQPITQVLIEPNTPDSTKQKLKLINEIRNFAFDSLGLTPTKNYTTYYNQHGKDILWVVTACAPYKFEPIEWSFPIIGSFTYKGFFDFEKGQNLAYDLTKKGFDVEMSPVSGWSTLGWFKDPVLSNMLEGTVGSMSNTIIHELTHGTLFIPDSMTFNENLASFIGRMGAQKFLAHTYGSSSTQVVEYTVRLNDSEQFTKYMILGAMQLDSLYKRFEKLPENELKEVKATYITSFIKNIDTVSFINPDRYKTIFKTNTVNNARFISFLNYRERQDEFKVQLEKEFNSDLVQFIKHWQNKYPK